jgi:hypothetical protein
MHIHVMHSTIVRLALNMLTLFCRRVAEVMMEVSSISHAENKEREKRFVRGKRLLKSISPIQSDLTSSLSHYDIVGWMEMLGTWENIRIV